MPRSRGRATPASSPATHRPDPVALLEEQAAIAGARAGADPLRPDAGLAVHLLPGRGADHGLATWPATPSSGLHAQICGDAHLSNFGVFGSPERRLIFDINDFDETLPGPWEWDVKRLAASLEIAGRDNGLGTTRRDEDRAGGRPRVPRGDGASRPSMTQPRASGTRTSTSRTLVPIVAEPARQEAREARSRRTSRRPEPRTACRPSRSSPTEVDGEPRIISDPPLIVPIEELAGHGSRRAHGIARWRHPQLPAHPLDRPAPPAGATSAWCTWPARWWASAASARAPGSCCCSGATARIRCSCRPRRPRSRCSSASSA